LPSSYHYHRRKGTSLPLPPETRYTTARRDSFVRSHLVNWKKHKLCLLSILLHHLLHIHNNVATERNDKPTVYSYRRQWNPCHMDFGLVFQQAIDRQDRTLQTEGRFSLLELHGDITTAWYTGILHRTRTRCKTTCLVGHHSIEATSCNRNDETISQPTSQETDFDSFASRTPLTPTPVNPSPKYWTPTLTPIDTDPIHWPKTPPMSNVSAQRSISS